MNEILGDIGIDWFQSDAEWRAELAQDISAAAYLNGDFVASSGQLATHYFDKYLFETRPTIMRSVARILGMRVSVAADRIAGRELGGVALAAVTSLETGLPFVIVRKPSDSHHTAARVAGELHPGERIVVVEDVVATGEQALYAAAMLREAGASVVGVLAVIDCQQGGGDAITANDLAFDALFRLEELVPREAI